MSKVPYMPVFTDALLGDTLHLTAEQFGAYMLLLFATWNNGGKPLLDDDAGLARICRCSRARWREKLRPALIDFFDISDKFLHQKRLEKEWKYVENKRAAGALGGKAKVLKKQETPSSKRPSKRPSKPLANGLANGKQTAYQTSSPNLSRSKEEGAEAPPPLLLSASAPLSLRSRGAPAGAPPAAAVVAAVVEAQPDLVQQVWDRGTALLGKQTTARNLIGKLRREYGDVAVLESLSATEAAAASERVPFLIGCLRERKARHDGDKLSAREKLFLGFAEAAADLGDRGEAAATLLDG